MTKTKYPTSATNPMGYWLQQPDAIKTLYPCICDLHGTGGRGPGTSATLDSLMIGPASAPTPGAWSETPQDLQVGANRNGMLLIAPQIGGDWSVKNVDDIIDIAISKHNADPNNIFLTGFSLGGGGVTRFITSPSAKRVKAAVSTGGLNWGTDWKQATMPVWFFHCADDPRVGVGNTNSAFASMEAIGLKPFKTIFPTGGHSYGTAYSSQETYGWMLGTVTPPVIPPIEPPVTNLPKANAGPDVTINTNTYELDGSASTGYSGGGWVPTGGSGNWWTVKPVGGWSGMKQKVIGLVDGKYEFTHYVYDNKGNKSEDKMTLTVLITTAKVPFASSAIPPGKTNVTVNTDKSFDFS